MPDYTYKPKASQADLTSLSDSFANMFYTGSALSTVQAYYEYMQSVGSPSISIAVIGSAVASAMGCNAAGGIAIGRYNGSRIDYIAFTGTKMTMGRIDSSYNVMVNWTAA